MNARNAAASNQAGPTREVIKPQVEQVIRDWAEGWGRPQEPLKEDHSLQTDLRLFAHHRRVMAIDYTEISLQYPGGKRVSQSSSISADTVGKAIDLVLARANGQ